MKTTATNDAARRACGVLSLLVSSLITLSAADAASTEGGTSDGGNLYNVRRFYEPNLDSSATARQLVVDVKDVMSVVLEEGDVLTINVVGDPLLTMAQAPINKGGSIFHPVLKELKVAGRTLREAQEMIHQILEEDYLVDPSVTLTISQYASYEFSVLDEILRPGTYSLPRDKKIDLAQAVAMAGGPTRVGSSKVVVERLVDGQRKTFKVDTSKPNNFVVQPDDKIKVGEKFW